MVERVRITPSQMVVRRADGSEAFNSDNKYLRTDNAGNMRLNRQLASAYYYTANDVVYAAQTNGACVANFKQSALSAGAQVTFAFPEFYGNLAIVQSGFNQLGGSPQVNVPYVTNVYRNGGYLGRIASRFLLSPQSGGAAVIQAFGEFTGFSPGDVVTIGGIDQYNNSGVLVSSNITPPAVDMATYGVFAYETGINSIPLSVTP